MDTFTPRAVNDGTTNEPLDAKNIPKHMAIAAFTAIAWCNVIELDISVYMIFKRKRGLYFWSVFLSIQGVMLHSLAFILKLYGVVRAYQVTITMVTVGWYLMVTGQSLVLYSRLHLVVGELKIIRAVLFMIIWNAVTLHIPTTVLTYGTNSPDPDDFHTGYRTMERIQMTIFCVQETLISAIYIWATLRFLQPFYKTHIRSVMLQLLWINVGIIIMDLAMLVVEYNGLYSLEVAMKGAIYSVKLKIEFTVLNQLMRIAKSSRGAHFSGGNDKAEPPSRPSSNTSGVRAFVRLILPQPNGDAEGEMGDAFIEAPALAKTASGRQPPRRAQVNGNMSTISSSRIRDGAHSHRESLAHGIAVTREVTQVSKPRDNEAHMCNQDKPPNYYYPGTGQIQTQSRTTSLEIVGDGIGSDKTDQSQIELVDLALPSSGHGAGLPDGHRKAKDSAKPTGQYQ